MRHALRLAERALGNAAPNPAVGCLIVSADGRIVGRGWTQRGGRPHAETVALTQAGDHARAATAYVTLEPCAHHGQTPPCANALAEAGIARVVAATLDPDPRVSGTGFALLESRGVLVTRGVLEAQAKALNAGFMKRVTEHRPLVALKLAQSLDGRVADAHGNSRWITSNEARQIGHLLRAQYDAIMIGIGTAISDDPLLTCRLPGLDSRSPIRVVLDSELRLPAESQLVRTARSWPVLVFTSARAGGDDLIAHGVEIDRVNSGENGLPAIGPVLNALADRGITRLLVEGGPRLHASLLKSGLADLVHLFVAPRLLGGNGLPGIGPAWQPALASAPHLRRIDHVIAGPDAFETLALEDLT